MNKAQLKTSENISNTMLESFNQYSERLQGVLATMDWSSVEVLCKKMEECWRDKKQIFICGNGGSAGNAIHLANDLIYGAGGLRAEALSANAAVLTCLANDISYDSIYSQQLRVKANPGDMLMVLSGSGNSGNIVNAITMAQSLGMVTVGVFGFDGGVCKDEVDILIHTPLDDMQIAEDMQLVVGHMVMQWLSANLININKPTLEPLALRPTQ
ncbi:MAG: SIS domain-containing protein [Spongiibacteraceae bacterium]|nr:SIS domain-containing protein [Spongiibacteraceae bacterium]